MGVKVGDKILFGKYSGQEFKLDRQDLLHMREDDIIGIVALTDPVRLPTSIQEKRTWQPKTSASARAHATG